MKRTTFEFAVAAAMLMTAVLCRTTPALACGPTFPNRLLLGGDDTLLLAPKVPEFDERIARLAEFRVVPFKTFAPEAGDYERQTANAKSADLAEAMKTRRAQNVMPDEFKYYEQGAKAYRVWQNDEAIAWWRRVLELPADERRYRSVWAAFMIGKALQQKNSYADSIPWFGKTRSLAQAGFADSIGLAAASYGWQGYSAWHLEHYDEALELYVLHLATGDPTARNSLFHTARRALDTDDENALNAAANSPVARQVVTAYLLSTFERGHPWTRRAKVWDQALAHAGAAPPDEVGRIAVLAYQAGDMDLAQRFASVADPQDVLGGWIRAKLLLRSGMVENAADVLATLARKLPRASDPTGLQFVHGSFYDRTGMKLKTDPVAFHMQAELAILRMSQRQFAEALNALLEGGHWIDAAYVAEYVLTADELKTYVDRVWPAKTDSQADSSAWTRRQIRHLLARRLTRIGRWREARSYFPMEWQSPLDAYIQAIRDGHDQRLSPAARGRRLFAAAQLARHRGIELLGTEVEPDWRAYGGYYTDSPATAVRQHDYPGELGVPSKEEFRRAAGHFPEPNVRWHYRYIAVDHAWEAASLMPDNDDETAQMLCVAGSWIKGRDPEGADKFYKALVRRCGQTPLGVEAEKLRWFPKVTETFGDGTK